MFLRFILVAILASTPLLAQDVAQSFVIDTTKPYVYLKFDHVADRKPISPGEPGKGLWIRLVNNCRIPIVLAIFNPETGDPGVGIYDEVIPVDIGGPIFTGIRPGETLPSEAPQEKPPKGYSSEVQSTTIVSPGRDLLFSVPINHVGPGWYMRIKFTFEISKARTVLQPDTLLDFVWQDIPKEYREKTRP